MITETYDINSSVRSTKYVNVCWNECFKKYDFKLLLYRRFTDDIFFSYSLISSNYLVVRNSKSNSYYLIVAQIFRHSLDGGIVLSDIKNVKVEKFEIYFVEK